MSESVIAIAALGLAMYMYMDTTNTPFDQTAFGKKQKHMLRRDLGPVGEESSLWECQENYLPSIIEPNGEGKTYSMYDAVRGGARDLLFAFEVYDENDTEEMKKAGIREGFPLTVTETQYGDRVFCSLATSGEYSDYKELVEKEVKRRKDAGEAEEGEGDDDAGGDDAAAAGTPATFTKEQWARKVPGAEWAGVTGAPPALYQPGEWGKVVLHGITASGGNAQETCLPCYEKNVPAGTPDAAPPAGKECRHVEYPQDHFMPWNLDQYVDSTSNTLTKPDGETTTRFETAFISAGAANPYVGCSRDTYTAKFQPVLDSSSA